MSRGNYTIDETPEGRSLVVTWDWSDEIARALHDPSIDGLVLNYARGYRENDLRFLESGWNIRRLEIIDRQLGDLRPVERLADSLEELSVQAGREATLDLGLFPALREVGAESFFLAPTLHRVADLRRVVTWNFGEPDLQPFSFHPSLEELTIKVARRLTTLAGIERLAGLRKLAVVSARGLSDIEAIRPLTSLEDLSIDTSPLVDRIDVVAGLTKLTFLQFSDCGDIESLRPIARLSLLDGVYLAGTTVIVDGDLSPLANLPLLTDLRMRNRPHYVPSATELMEAARRAR